MRLEQINLESKERGKQSVFPCASKEDATYAFFANVGTNRHSEGANTKQENDQCNGFHFVIIRVLVVVILPQFLFDKKVTGRAFICVLLPPHQKKPLNKNSLPPAQKKN
jgi:hypothetical protein